MSAVKIEAARMIERLPDDTDWTTVAYRFYVRALIESGLADAEAGRVVSHEDVVQEMDEWLASYKAFESRSVH